MTALADYLAARQDMMLREWRDAIKRDPTLATGDSLPKVQLLDHIPAILWAFENQLRANESPSPDATNNAVQGPAAAHGLLRWQQGYDLKEVTRELGKLNECVVSQLKRFTLDHPSVAHAEMARAYALWSDLCAKTVEESVNQYFKLQQQEAIGHVKDLEAALAEIRGLEAQQADLWRQAAHDLRGNLSVVANATVGLTNRELSETTRDKFTRMLMRNVTSLHQLLDDVTSLARLQAGRELRRIQPLDVTPIFQQLCDGIGEVARQRNLYLHAEGPPGFSVDGDPIKIARIAQNLILNAVKYTHEGGVIVRWGDSDAGDPKRWILSVTDTGPGFHTASGKPLARALEGANQVVPGASPDAAAAGGAAAVGTAAVDTPAVGTAAVATAAPRAAASTPYTLSNVAAPTHEPGEGIGLSIVKRLCELLDATIEMESTPGVGTSFRILFPRHYSQ